MDLGGKWMAYSWRYDVNKYGDKYEVYLVGEDTTRKVCECDDRRFAEDIARALTESYKRALEAFCAGCGSRISPDKPAVMVKGLEEPEEYAYYHVGCYEE
jgi:hypothetical protein